MPKTITYPAFLEVRTANGETAFASTEKVLASVELQSVVVDKRKLARIREKMRKNGLLYDVPYVGPRPLA